MYRIKEKELLEDFVGLVLRWQRYFHVMIKPALVCENENDVLNYRCLIGAQRVSESRFEE
jgi:hypothetical protein